MAAPRSLRSYLTGPGALPWPVLGFLIAAALLPSAAVLWFMSAAVDNTSAAAQARLVDAYRAQLSSTSSALRSFWSARREALERAGEPPSETFARILAAGLADAAVVLDDRGRVVYPDARHVPAFAPPDSEAWSAARRLEDRGDDAAAASAYAAVARVAGPDEAAR